MYPDLSPTLLIALAAAAELASLLLFGRANTLWRSPGMLQYPQRFLVIRSVLVLVWVHLGVWAIAPEGLAASYPAVASSSLWLLLLGMLGGLGLLLFSLSIRSMPAQLVFFGGSLHLIVAVCVGWLLGELVSPLRLLVIALLLGAQILVLWRDRASWSSLRGAARLMPFVVGVIWGTYFPLYGLALKQWGFWPTVIATEWGVLLLMLCWFAFRRSGTWRDAGMWRAMTEQSVLSSVAQVLSGVALWWGGVIFHSILTNFNVVVNLTAFKIRFGETTSLRYLGYFLLYIALAAALVLGS
ncbi:MAG: hypothetical protein LW601_06920 [Cryomorphaceae bacterium]|jgi:hypothetical protein|nr:hypothetical protein [Cryomorphaceae bacterium]